MYYTKNEKKIVFVYPTPANIDKIQYRDFANNCYDFESKQHKCNNNAKEIPIQY